ncbi:MAG: LacI family DNA-binding transcriptional regulator [Pseudomonadota bacterium]
MKQKAGSIRDIARETGRSVATVSRALNGSQSVTKETRDTIMEAVERLNYIPNPAARALTTKRSRTIAAVVPTLEHSIFARFLSSVERTVTQLGYSLVIAVNNSNLDEELATTRKLLGMGAEGFIFSGAQHREELYTLLERRSAPYVFTSCWDPQATAPTIGYDNHALARDAVEYLYGLGHRDIGILHSPLATNDRARARLDGAQSFEAADIQLTVCETELSVTGGLKCVTELLAEKTNVTALLCFSDVIALGARFALDGAGWRVPHDMSLMGFDNLEWSENATPPLTTFELPSREMGQKASEVLIEKLEGGKEIEPFELYGSLIVGGSTARIGNG